jgi:hypothetical protein
MRPVLTTRGCSAAVFTVLCLSAGVAFGAPASGAKSCADPAVDIQIALISKTGPTTGRVRITGIVKNNGSAAWVATSPSHRLHMVLAQQNSAARPDGNPVEPAIAIVQLKPGKQIKIDHQVNWDARTSASYPRFIVRIFNVGRIGSHVALSSLDCRTDNNRKEVTVADINKLFGPVMPSGPPLKVQGYRLLGGVGVNTVETTLAYSRASSGAGKITASVAAPYSGISDDVLIEGKSGLARIRVNIPCNDMEGSNRPPTPVTIFYRLWGSLGLPGATGWVVSFSAEHAIPYREVCPARSRLRP